MLTALFFCLQARDANSLPPFARVLGGFKDYEFYTGESMNPDGMIALLNYRPDGTTPFFTFWKDGLKATKLVRPVLVPPSKSSLTHSFLQ